MWKIMVMVVNWPSIMMNEESKQAKGDASKNDDDSSSDDNSSSGESEIIT
jgi:hypothetical protein